MPDDISKEPFIAILVGVLSTIVASSVGSILTEISNSPDKTDDIIIWTLSIGITVLGASLYLFRRHSKLKKMSLEKQNIQLKQWVRYLKSLYDDNKRTISNVADLTLFVTKSDLLEKAIQYSERSEERYPNGWLTLDEYNEWQKEYAEYRKLVQSKEYNQRDYLKVLKNMIDNLSVRQLGEN